MWNLSKLQSLSIAILLICSFKLDAQQMGIEFDAEFQFNTDGCTNYVNLLRLNADYPLSEHLQFSAATISVTKTRGESLLDDLQGFSNIEAGNQPLTLALTGIGWTPSDKHSLFLGIRTVNEDYFASPVTSFFLNSSCGIFPTLASNMDIANYPFASMGVHYCYTAPSFCLQASAYNGQAYDHLTGAANLWRITPHSDGLFFISQLDWQWANGHYFAGAAQHTGQHDGASPMTVLWAYTEQAVTDRLSLIADYSHAFGHDRQCTDFAGLGGLYAWPRSTLGFFTDYVRFCDDTEWAAELTYEHRFTSRISLKTSSQLIHHGSWQPVGMIRVSVRI